MIAFITGASSGFGAALVRKFVREGAQVVAAARRVDRLEELAATLGPDVYPLALDVSSRTAVEAAVEGLPSEWAEIDVLINNAGLALGLTPAAQASVDDWDRMVDTNIKGLVYCTRALLPGMLARNRGTIVNIGSIAGSYPYPGSNVYGATKAFVHQFTLNLRADLLGSAVRASCIEPGMCSGTEFSEVRFHGDRERADAVYRGVDALTPEDVAETVHWVATRPAHVNINVLELMPVQQAFGPLAVKRRDDRR